MTVGDLAKETGAICSCKSCNLSNWQKGKRVRKQGSEENTRLHMIYDARLALGGQPVCHRPCFSRCAIRLSRRL
jgi:hypothetical protein